MIRLVLVRLACLVLGHRFPPVGWYGDRCGVIAVDAGPRRCVRCEQPDNGVTKAKSGTWDSPNGRKWWAGDRLSTPSSA